MKVLLVHYEWPEVTDCGGSGRMACQLRQRLQARGHDVPLVTDRADGHYLTFPVRYHRHIDRRIKETEPDVLFAHSTLPTAVGCGRLADKHDIPLVVKTMGSDVYNPLQFQAVRPVLDRVNARVFDAADRIVCPSIAMGEHVPERYRDAVTVIPNGIDPDAWTWREHSLHRPLRILTVARIEAVKRIADAVAMGERLRRRGRDIRYRVVGDGDHLPDVRTAWGDRDWVELTGWAENVQQHMNWGDIFLLPSAHESFGIVLLEALASGLPVVTTETGGQSEIVEPEVGVVTAGHSVALADGIECVANSYDRYQRATAGYVDERYRLDDMTDAYEQLFTGLAGETTTGSAETTAQTIPQHR